MVVPVKLYSTLQADKNRMGRVRMIWNSFLFRNFIMFDFTVECPFRNPQIHGSVFSFVIVFFQGFDNKLFLLLLDRKGSIILFVHNVFYGIVLIILLFHFIV